MSAVQFWTGEYSNFEHEDRAAWGRFQSTSANIGLSRLKYGPFVSPKIADNCDLEPIGFCTIYIHNTTIAVNLEAAIGMGNCLPLIVFAMPEQFGNKGTAILDWSWIQREYITIGEGLLSEVLTVISRSDMITDCVSVISGEGTHWTLRDQSVSIRKSHNDVHVLRDMRVSFGTSHLALGNRHIVKAFPATATHYLRVAVFCAVCVQDANLVYSACKVMRYCSQVAWFSSKMSIRSLNVFCRAEYQSLDWETHKEAEK